MLQKWWGFFSSWKTRGKKWTDSHLSSILPFMWSKLFHWNLTDRLKHYFAKKDLEIQVQKCLRTDTRSRIWISQVLGSEDPGNSASGLIIRIEERPPHLILFPSAISRLSNTETEMCIHCWVGGTRIHTSQGQEWLKEPPIARVQRAGQTRGHVPSMTSFNRPQFNWNSNVLCSPSLLAPSCSREPSLDGWSSCMRWTWEWKPGARLVEQKDESLWVSQPSHRPEHLHFKRERKKSSYLI